MKRPKRRQKDWGDCMDIGNLLVTVIIGFLTLMAGIEIGKSHPEPKENQELRTSVDRLYKEKGQIADKCERLIQENKELKSEIEHLKNKNAPHGRIYD